jgi:UDP-N-acetyl-D-mannosaminuronic acid dehydrogenase
MAIDLDVCVVGGCGHVGLPLALVFADRGMKAGIHDIDEETTTRVRKGEMLFLERGAERLFGRALQQGLEVANDPDMIRRALYVVVVIGTPVDEHLNQRFNAMRDSSGTRSSRVLSRASVLSCGAQSVREPPIE